MDSAKLYEKSLRYFSDLPKSSTRGEEFRKPKSSWHLVAWVIGFSKLKKSDKLVAAQIASHYNINRGDCYPSYNRLVSETGLSRGTVAKAIKNIKHDGTEWKVTTHGSSEELSLRSNKYIPLAPKNPNKTIQDDE
jgi:hypothetical protein